MKPPSAHGADFTVATAQGTRAHQEDRAVHTWIEKIGWLLAVFDGHRGADSAEKASKALLSAFNSARQSTPGQISAVLRQTVRSLVELTHQNLSGTTASIVFIPEDARYVSWAVLGDSPIAVLDAEHRIHLGPDHNVRTNPEERAAALERGGNYKRGYLEDPHVPGIGIQMARSLGDMDLTRVLSREPDVAEVPLLNPEIVLIGTDGLLSPGESSPHEQLSRFLQMAQKGADAKALVHDALHRQTGDNVTVLVWRKV